MFQVFGQYSVRHRAFHRRSVHVKLVSVTCSATQAVADNWRPSSVDRRSIVPPTHVDFAFSGIVGSTKKSFESVKNIEVTRTVRIRRGQMDTLVAKFWLYNGIAGTTELKRCYYQEERHGLPNSVVLVSKLNFSLPNDGGRLKSNGIAHYFSTLNLFYQVRFFYHLRLKKFYWKSS